jgi:hypothetical protein
MVLKMESASELPWRQDGFLYLFIFNGQGVKLVLTAPLVYAVFWK